MTLYRSDPEARLTRPRWKQQHQREKTKKALKPSPVEERVDIPWGLHRVNFPQVPGTSFCLCASLCFLLRCFLLCLFVSFFFFFLLLPPADLVWSNVKKSEEGHHVRQQSGHVFVGVRKNWPEAQRRRGVGAFGADGRSEGAGRPPAGPERGRLHVGSPPPAPDRPCVCTGHSEIPHIQ